MKTVNLKVIRIGNNWVVRLPATLLSRYRIEREVSAELRPEGILLKSAKDDRLAWKQTARAMVEERDGEFSEFEKAAAGDGLESPDR